MTKNILSDNNTINAKKDDKASKKEWEIIESLREENAALRATIHNLTKEIAEIRNELRTIKQQSSNPSSNSNKTEEVMVNQESTDKEPASKKRAVEPRKHKGGKNIDSSHNLEVKFAKLEELFTSMTRAIETFQTENISRLTCLETTLQPIASHSTFAPLIAQLNQGTQAPSFTLGQSWPPTQQA